MTDAVVTRKPADDDERDEDASEAQAQIIASLRAQVTDLFSQVTQLNGKLVASYDRVSDLEDQLHDTSSSLRNASVTISSLELERSHHLAALNTGLLVEKAHVTTELNRLMERATEEAAQRGQAETARRDIEKDLDDLSASLFDQANTMVAEARLNQAQSERKVQGAEQALKIAEDAVKDMQYQMQSLQAEKEVAERDAREYKLTMSKGKWVESDDSRVQDVPRIRFMTTHGPYAEFIAFVTHLRGLRASQPTPPVISTLLNQPFIARMVNEDSEPTVRLDLAPSLNWLSRRSVLAAIHTGMLTVEPVSFSSLVQELHQHLQSTSNSSVSCALCGTPVARLPSTPVPRTYSPNGTSWFKYPLTLGSMQNLNPGTLPPAGCEPPGQVYIFRLANPATPAPPSISPTHTSSVSTSAVGTSSRPINAISLHSSRVTQAQTHSLPYPLCTSNYCMTRLRSTCSLWAFVRVGIVERIWEEEVVQPPKALVNGDSVTTSSPPASAGAGNQPPNGTTVPPTSEKPPVPPRRRRLWEMASALGERASALGERAVSWGKENGENAPGKEDITKKIPPYPPSHPAVPHLHTEAHLARIDEPPPLPKRNVVRGKSSREAVVPPSIQSQPTAPESKEPDAKVNGHTDPDKATPNASDSPSTADEITFATPPSEASTLPTSDPVTTESRAPPAQEPSSLPAQDREPQLTQDSSSPPAQDSTPLLAQDSSSSPSPHDIPLPATPTSPTPVAHGSSPALRPRSRLSSPATPPPSNPRPTSPALSRSRAGSPAPRIVRGTSPSPGHAPSASQIRGKLSTSSPLAPSSRPTSPAPASGPAAPPIPRRAAARRAVPPPPDTEAKAGGESGKQEAGSAPTAASSTNSSPEVNVHKIGEQEVAQGAKSNDATRNGEGTTDVVVREAADLQVVPAVASATEVGLGPVKDVVVSHQEAQVNGKPATMAIDPHPSTAVEGDGSTSAHSVSTKHSSSTEGEGFASDATWEERTWKELVRLKEDMFWARIGGIRTLQG